MAWWMRQMWSLPSWSSQASREESWLANNYSCDDCEEKSTGGSGTLHQVTRLPRGSKKSILERDMVTHRMRESSTGEGEGGCSGQRERWHRCNQRDAQSRT